MLVAGVQVTLDRPRDGSPFGRWLACGLLVCTATVQAAMPTIDPDWKETDAPTAPAFSTSQLLPLEMPSYVSLKFGVDPATLSITADGIVRYVVVAVNASGSVNAMFEGIRCATGEVKTYARTGTIGTWSYLKEPAWRNLTDNLPSKHALALARQGACDGRSTTASSTADIVKALKK
jgi:hypothetical protein